MLMHQFRNEFFTFLVFFFQAEAKVRPPKTVSPTGETI